MRYGCVNQTFCRYRFKVADTATDILPKKVADTAIAIFREKVARYFSAIDTRKM